MPIWKAYFNSQIDAEAYAARADERSLAALTAIGVAAGQTQSTPTPSVRTKVLAIETIPPFALPIDAPSTTRVYWQTTDASGAIETTQSTMPTAQVPGLRKTSGTVKFLAAQTAQVTVRGRVGKKIQTIGLGGPASQLNGAITAATVTITLLAPTTSFPATGFVWIEGEQIPYTGKAGFTLTGCTVANAHPDGAFACGDIFIPTDTKLVEPVSGKQYKTPTDFHVPNSGPGVVDINEVNSGELGDVTYGTLLSFVSGPSGLTPFAQVSQMADYTVSAAEPMTSAVSGRQYVIIGGAIVSSSETRLGGYLEATIDCKSLVSDGMSAALGEEIDFDTTPDKCLRAAHISTALSHPVPIGTVFENGTGQTYSSLADVVLGDSLEISVAFRADADGTASDFDPLALPVSVTVPDAPTGVYGTASVTACALANAYPASIPPVFFGDELSLETFIAHESDGRWSVRIATLPLGT